MKEAFIQKSFNRKSRVLIEQALGILEEYKAQGFRLSLRQLYYQFVARDLLPNATDSYNKLGSLISDAREAGLVDWLMIEDRGRRTVIPTHWSNPGEIVQAARDSYHLDRWENQEYHIEVMVEKDALSGVLEPVCRRLDVGITANKGYSSSSTMYRIGSRISWQASLGKKILVLYLGDHDPSGIDMTRDVEERLSLYSRLGDIEVVRLALNYDQVELWGPPENPAKTSDSRFARYADEFGESSWELDAVEPAVLGRLVQDAVEGRIDWGAWDDQVALENAGKKELQEFVDRYKDGK